MPNQNENTETSFHVPEMVFIEGGTFEMGSNKREREQPIHSVTIPGFYLGKYPVTNLQFFQFLQAYGSDKVKEGEYAGESLLRAYEKGIIEMEGQWLVAKGYADHPMVRVSWYGAMTYCEWLLQQTGQSYRLPSEAEWEFAARGGRGKESLTYAGSQKLKEVGWFNRNSHNGTMPVGLKYPNQLGLYDMSGQVREWCADHWHDDYEGALTDGSAWVTGGDASRRVVRGGSWSRNGSPSRVSLRVRSDADGRDYGIGFRVSRY